MLALLISCFSAFLMFFVAGKFISGLFKKDLSFTDLLLLGLVTTNTIFSLISIISPLNSMVWGAALIICLALLPRLKMHKWWGIWRRPGERSFLIFGLAFVICAFFISLSASNSYDTYLYHLQSIKWIEEYKAIPGLANLHDRFGFNPNIFTVYAITSLQDVFKQEIFSVNYAIFVIICFYLLSRISRIYRESGFSNVFILFLASFYFLLSSHHFLSSTTPDFAVIILILYVFLRAIEISRITLVKDFENFLPILLISIYLITVKLSAIPVLILALIILLKIEITRRQFFLLSGLTGVILIPWMTRNLIISGWIIYPFPYLDIFSFDWKVPGSNVVFLKDQIKGWARLPGKDYLEIAQLPIDKWLPLWWKDQSFTHRFLIGIGTFNILMVLIVQSIKRIKLNWVEVAILLSCTGGIFFWLLTAPDFRLGKIYILSGLLSPLLLFNLKSKFPDQKAYFLKISLFVLLINFLRIGFLNNKGLFQKLDWVLTPQKIVPPEGLEFRQYKIRNTTIFIPTKGERCFGHELPCTTPFMDFKSLELRGEEIENGFKVK